MKNSNKQRKGLLAATIALFAGSAQVATAQDNDAATSQGILDEIIVTATKRETTLNDTASSIAAIGGDALARRDLSSMDDLLRFIPGVNIIDRGAGLNTVIVRGISANPEEEQLRSGTSVGVYFGEVPLSALGLLGGTADLQMVDLERVEMLRGPQGTLFGSGSLNGTVRNIPKQPNLNSLEGSLKATFSNTAKNGDNNNKVQAVINVPLIENELAFRAVAYQHDTSGYIRNLAASDETYSAFATSFGAGSVARDRDDVGTTEYTGGRLSVLWQPNDQFSANLQYVTQDGDQMGLPFTQLTEANFEQLAMEFGDIFASNPEGSLFGNNLTREGITEELSFTNLVMEYQMDWGTILSSSLVLDHDGATANDATAFVAFPLAQLISSNTEAFVQEIRFVSDLDGPFQFLVGLYYEDIENTLANPTHLIGDMALAPAWAQVPLDSGNSLIDQFFWDRETSQQALFGELSYDVTEMVTLTVGGRYFDYERDFETRNYGAFTGILDPDMAVITGGTQEEDGTIFKANIAYQPHEEMLLYGQWSEGFRLGQVPDQVGDFCDLDDDGLLDGTNAVIGAPINSDKLESFELGGKFTGLDNRLQVNAAVFYITWDGIPIRTTAVSDFCFTGIVNNAGEAESTGFEIESSIQVTDQIVLNLGGSYAKSELTASSQLGDDGDRLPGSPEYNVNMGLQYDFSLNGREGYVRGNYAYVGGFHNDLQETSAEAGDYGELSLSAGTTIDQVTLEIFGKNLTNEDALTWVGTLVPDSRAYRLRPRTLGLNVTYNF